MFDPAASLMKTMGLAMPADAAGSVIPAMPGETAEAAGSGGFASLLATKIDAATPDLKNHAATLSAFQPAAETSAPALLAPAAADLPAKALPATGKMLPLDLPVALPVAQAASAAPPTPPAISANTPMREEAKVAKAAPQPAAPAIAMTAPMLGQAQLAPKGAAADQALAPTPSPALAAAAAPVQKAAPFLTPMAARAAALATQPAEEAGPAPEPEAALPARSVPAPLVMLAAVAKPRPALRGAEAQAAEIPEPAEDQPQPAFEAQEEEPARSPVVVEEAPVILAAAPAVPANPAPLEAKPAEPLPAAPRPRGAAPLPAVATMAREVSPEAPRTELPQQVQQTAQPLPQATIRIAAAPAEARREGEPAPVVAPPVGDAEPASETAPTTAAPRTAQPFAMLSPVLPAQAPLTLSAMPASAVQGPTDFAQIVDRLVAAREAVAPAEVRVTLDHVQFGKVSVGFTPDASGMSVTLAAADPEFARAVEAAAPFAPPTASETQPVPAPAAARGADLSSAFTGQQGQQAPRQSPQDARPSGPQANPSARTPDSDEKPGKGRGIFA